PWLFVVLLPLLLAVLLCEITDGSIDAKAVAVLGVLVACGAALRAPTTGATGFTGVFFLLLPGGRVFGRAFGFVQGALTLFASGPSTSPALSASTFRARSATPRSCSSPGRPSSPRSDAPPARRPSRRPSTSRPSRAATRAWTRRRGRDGGRAGARASRRPP